MGFWNIKGLRKEHLDATRTDTSLFSLERLKILPFFRELQQKEQIPQSNMKGQVIMTA